jgi:hypothetical protein
MANELPNKRSELLLAAVHDAKAFEAAGGKLRMSVWLQRNDWDPRCQACMAGAVMHQRLGLRPAEPAHGDCEEVVPEECDEDTVDKLYAIDSMRCGEFDEVSHWLDRADDAPMSAVQDAAVDAASALIRKHYGSESPGRAPWPIYEQAAAILAAVGL